MHPPRLRFRTLCLTAAAAAALIAAPVALAPKAFAQTSMEDPLDARDARRVDRMEKVIRELRAIVYQGQNSGKPIVVQPADTDYRMQQLSERLGDLEQTLQRVNGSLDLASRDAAQAKRDNEALKAQVRDLTDRLTKLEQMGAPPPEASLGDPAQGGAPAPAPAGGNATQAFAGARQLMLNGDYDGAEAAFAAYIQAYPDSPKTPEARYWWGKTLVVRGSEAQAATAFIGAIRGWPQTTWAPDAVVELARSLIALKKPTDACQTLAELGRRYPKAPAAVATRATAARAQAKC